MSTRTAHVQGQIVQVFEAGEHEVYRLLIDSSVTVDSKKIEVTSEGLTFPTTTTDLEKNTGGESILSLVLPKGIDSFDILYEERPLARMRPDEKRRLCIERDLRMVNPGIDGAYHEWLILHEKRLERARRTPLTNVEAPLISIVVPLYQTPPVYLRELLDSIVSQTYAHWELVLVNASPEDQNMRRVLSSYVDHRIRILEIEKNLGIAGNTNVGIRATTGDYVAFCDHDDTLDSRALEMYVRMLEKDPDADLLYCDEDNIHASLKDRYSPLLKPGFNLDLLYSHNYIVHMLMVSRRALNLVELSPDNTSGAQDYDLTLKVSEIARSIVHVPYVLYHWRAHPGSTNGGVMESKPYAIEASVRALNTHFFRRGVNARAIPTDIPCVFSTVYELKKGSSTGVVIAKHGASLAHETNLSLADTTTDFIVLMREGVELPSSSLQQLVNCLSQRDDLGAVAPKLYYRDGLIAHAGLALTGDGSVVALNQNFTEHMGGGYHGFAECSCDYSAVSPECIVTRANLLRNFGGLSESFNNDLLSVLDYCLFLREQGLRLLVLPDAAGMCSAPVLYPGRDIVKAYGPTEKLAAFKDKWGDALRHDVLENPGVTFASAYPVLNVGRDIEKETKRLLRERPRLGIFERIRSLI